MLSVYANKGQTGPSDFPVVGNDGSNRTCIRLSAEFYVTALFAFMTNPAASSFRLTSRNSSGLSGTDVNLDSPNVRKDCG